MLEKLSATVNAHSGVCLLLLLQLLNSVMILTCKLLETDAASVSPFNPVQILFARMFITYVCCLVYMYTTGRVADAPFGPPLQRVLLVLRGCFGFFGVFGLYYLLQYLSVSDAVSITFLVPMVTAFFAWLALGERYSLLEATCALLSLVGILLIAKPDFLFGEQDLKRSYLGDLAQGQHLLADLLERDAAESSLSRLRVLATVVGLVGVCGALSVYVLLRKIGTAAHPLISVSYFALTTCLVCLFATLVVPGLLFQFPNTRRQWLLFALIGFSGFFMQFCLAAGLQREKAGKSSLLIYTNMVFALAWDFIFWGHVPGLLSILGTALIIANAYIVIRYKPTPEPEPAYHDIEEVALDFIVTDSDLEEPQPQQQS